MTAIETRPLGQTETAGQTDEKLEQFQRFVVESPSEKTQREYRSGRNLAYRTALKKSLAEFARRAVGWAGANPKRVQHDYDNLYAQGVSELARYMWPDVNAHLLFRGKPYLAGIYSIKRVQLVHLIEAVRAAGAESVLEMGFGSGINLVSLAILEPRLSLTGVEFTASGAKLAHSLAADPPPELLRYLGVGPLNDSQRAALGRIRFIQADAAAIPLPDKQFDLVFTIQVLEQMGWRNKYKSALCEARRLARKRAVFIECFRECNSLPQRFYLTYKNFFRDRWRRFGDYGLEPVSFSDDVPMKFLYQAGVLICDVR